MTSSTNVMSKLAAIVGAIAILVIGGGKSSMADSNDGGSRKYTARDNGFVRPPTLDLTTRVPKQRAKAIQRNSRDPAFDAYGSQGGYSGSVPNLHWRWELFRGPQG
jgi:hypothetical protein